jgi:hypothetical protein
LNDLDTPSISTSFVFACIIEPRSPFEHAASIRLNLGEAEQDLRQSLKSGAIQLEKKYQPRQRLAPMAIIDVLATAGVLLSITNWRLGDPWEAC